MPALAYGSNLAFIQMILGYVIARIILAVVMVPHYLKGEIYSPYQLFADRLGASGAEKRFLQGCRRDLGQFFGQRDLVGVGIERGRVDEPPHLLAHALHDLGVVVAHAGGEDAAEEVQVALPGHIPHVEPRAVIQGQRVGVIEDVVGP